jgi:hypothetical protein
VAALVPILALQAAFPEGGTEPFVAGAFWPALAGTVVVGVLLAREGRGLLATGAALYALALIASFFVQTAVGGNVARLGALLAGPLIVGALWRRQTLVLAVAAPLLAYWSVIAPIRDLSQLVGDPSVHAAYYAPLLDELQTRTQGRPVRIEVPLTASHWEANYVAERFPLARGWERQLDTHYAALFYEPTLSPTAYRAWLTDNAVAFVALPDAQLDIAGRQEGALVARGLPFLVEVWRAAHWRLYAVRDPAPLAAPPARLVAMGGSRFVLDMPRAARTVVRERFTPYWAVVAGRGCVGPAAGGWTAVSSPAAGRIVVGIRFSLTRVRARTSRCVH